MDCFILILKHSLLKRFCRKWNVIAKNELEIAKILILLTFKNKGSTSKAHNIGAVPRQGRAI